MKKYFFNELGTWASILSLIIAVSSIYFNYDGFKFFAVIIISILVLLLIYTKVRSTTKLKDLEVIYSITIKNVNGDARIIKRVFFQNTSNKPVDEREHRAFSTGSPVIDNNELNLIAYDEDNNPIKPIILFNKPTLKKFKINFSRSISPRDTYSYTYCYNWPKMFPDDLETFTASDVSNIIEFNINSCNGLIIEQAIAKEIEHDNSSLAIKEIDRIEDKFNNVIKLRIMKKNPTNQIELNLNLKRNFHTNGGGGG
jgi:hypothetical protein